MRRTLPFLALTVALLGACSKGDAPDGKKGTDLRTATGAEALAAYDRGLDYLRTQAKDGNYADPGMTALAASAFLKRPGGVRAGDRDLVDGLLEYVAGFQKADGGIYDKELANYMTCAAVMALTEAPGGAYAEAVDRAAKFIASLQKASGGIGYSESHPDESDLSNTQFAIESMRKAGVPLEHPVYSKALKFLQSVQNRTESNPAEYALQDGRIVAIQDDGGAFYKPTESKAGSVDLPDGRVALRSYGSMTYALLKCYLLAGLSKDDPRVAAAVKWIEDNYTVEENPGFDTAKDPAAAQQGYYYYLFTLARAFDLLGEETIVDSDGIEHGWRKDLREALLSRQRPDGSWINEHARWMETKPVLVTSYALDALSCCVR